MTTITVLRPLRVQSPRAAAVAARLFLSLLEMFEQKAMQRSERSQARIRAKEAAELRAYATQLQSQDPRFAADLLAAADRHQAAD